MSWIDLVVAISHWLCAGWNVRHRQMVLIWKVFHSAPVEQHCLIPARVPQLTYLTVFLKRYVGPSCYFSYATFWFRIFTFCVYLSSVFPPALLLSLLPHILTGTTHFVAVRQFFLVTSAPTFKRSNQPDCLMWNEQGWTRMIAMNFRSGWSPWGLYPKQGTIDTWVQKL